MTFSELESVFKSYLYLDKEKDFLPVIIATVLTNRLDVEPVWLMVIAPPSSGKTKVTSSLAKCKEVTVIGLLTPNSLISGARKKDTEDGRDPSLLAKIDGKTLLIKDASTITEMHPAYRSIIFSQLRSAFDGDLAKDTGLGRKDYNAKFGMIICGTPELERMRTFEASLGERFLYFRPSYDIPDYNSMWDKIKEGKHGLNEVNKILSDAVIDFLSTHNVKGVPVQYSDEIYNLAQLLVILRAAVHRDYKTREIDWPTGDHEAPIRVAKQLSSLYTALLSIVSDKKRAIHILKRVVKHSIPYSRLRVLTAIQRQKINTQVALIEALGSSRPTMKRLLEDLTVLKILTVNDDVYSISPQYHPIFYLRPMR
jgi:hypothetical protein